MSDRTPQIEKMAFNYLKEVIIQDSFQKSVLGIRQKFTNGVVEMTETDSRKKSLQYMPPHVLEEFSDPRIDTEGLKEEIYKSILVPFGLNNAFYLPIRNYIIDDQKPAFDETDWGMEGIVNGINFGFAKTVEVSKIEFNLTHDKELENSAYPVAIKLNPYISERALLDYIKKEFKFEILPKLKLYRTEKSVLGKQRTKKEQVVQRNYLIYYFHSELGWKPKNILKFLMRAQADFFKIDLAIKSLDVGAINKIISLERKRRKQM